MWDQRECAISTCQDFISLRIYIYINIYLDRIGWGFLQAFTLHLVQTISVIYCSCSRVSKLRTMSLSRCIYDMWWMPIQAYPMSYYSSSNSISTYTNFTAGQLPVAMSVTLARRSHELLLPSHGPKPLHEDSYAQRRRWPENGNPSHYMNGSEEWGYMNSFTWIAGRPSVTWHF